MILRRAATMPGRSRPSASQVEGCVRFSHYIEHPPCHCNQCATTVTLVFTLEISPMPLLFSSTSRGPLKFYSGRKVRRSIQRGRETLLYREPTVVRPIQNNRNGATMARRYEAVKVDLSVVKLAASARSDGGAKKQRQHSPTSPCSAHSSFYNQVSSHTIHPTSAYRVCRVFGQTEHFSGPRASISHWNTSRRRRC